MTASRCRGHATGHDGREPRRYFTGYGPARTVATLCTGCLAGLAAIGMSWRPERRADPARADRTPRPAWLARLRARTDESWRLPS